MSLMMNYSELSKYFLLALFSLSVGSFLNVVIYRLPKMLLAEWRSECQTLLHLEPSELKPLNLFLPRSFCPNCNHIISAWINIPLLSYFLLKGKCNNCSQPISFYYPLVEFLTCLLALAAAYHFGFGLKLVFALLFISFLIPLFFIDLKQQFLPDSLTLSLLWLGLIANTQELFTSLTTAVFSAVVAYLFLWLFIKIFYLITGKIGMGNGDFKLFAALAAWFGWTQLLNILIISSLSGAIIGSIYLKITAQTKDSPIPFGPFLCLAGIIILFYGELPKLYVVA